MKEDVGSPIVIHEMEPDVFRHLLHFIYTDSLPVLEMARSKGGARPGVAMAGHLLVAADRYNIERLKLICEHKLCKHIDANMVATTLALAMQTHGCMFQLSSLCMVACVLQQRTATLVASS
jgi:speckle-type POZ protein